MTSRSCLRTRRFAPLSDVELGVHGGLLLLAFLALHVLALVANTLALVGLRRLEARISAASWPTFCLSMPETVINSCLAPNLHFDTGRDLVDHLVAVADEELQVLAFMAAR